MPDFDLNTAREMVDSFSSAGNLCCRLLSATGEVLYQQGSEIDECGYLRSLPGQAPVCQELHLRGLLQAQQFGGRYIYSCASGLTFFSAPILANGAMSGGLVAGPVLLMDVDDYLDDLIEKREIPAGEIRPLRNFLSGLPMVTPARLRHLSIQLFADAVCISDSSHELILQRNEAQQQRSIGEYVHQVKAGQQEAPYPMESEQAMIAAIAQGDKPTASAMLNEILGHIFFFTRDPDTIQSRITELLVVLSRAAISGGASTATIFDVNHRYMQELKQLHTQEDVAHWLARVLNRFTDLVFDLVDSKHKNIIRKAVSYMNANCAKNLTLAEVADHVGYSHSHFSKVFKEEMGCGFRAYLNQVRVEKSKALLLSGNASIAEICDMCGFEDQSYHCKVFKKLVGVTPDKYRKQSRRIDSHREYGR